MLNEKEFDFLGITKWHEAGYKGRGVKITSHEKIIEGSFDDVFYLEAGDSDSDYHKHRNTCNGLYQTSSSRSRIISY